MQPKRQYSHYFSPIKFRDFARILTYGKNLHGQLNSIFHTEKAMPEAVWHKYRNCFYQIINNESSTVAKSMDFCQVHVT